MDKKEEKRLIEEFLGISKGNPETWILKEKDFIAITKNNPWLLKRDSYKSWEYVEIISLRIDEILWDLFNAYNKEMCITIKDFHEQEFEALSWHENRFYVLPDLDAVYEDIIKFIKWYNKSDIKLILMEERLVHEKGYSYVVDVFDDDKGYGLAIIKKREFFLEENNIKRIEWYNTDVEREEELENNEKWIRIGV